MGANGDKVIKIKDLCVYYSTLRGYVKAVKEADLDIYRGEVIGLVGESGSGKSTLAMAIMRILSPTVKIVKGSRQDTCEEQESLSGLPHLTVLRRNGAHRAIHNTLPEVLHV